MLHQLATPAASEKVEKHFWNNGFCRHGLLHQPATPTVQTVLFIDYTRGIYAEGHHGDPNYLLIGRGLTEEEAPAARVIPDANLCDEVVDGVPRYCADGMISASQQFIEVDGMFAAAMAGQIVQREGSVDVEAGQAKAVVVTITDDDLVVGEPVSFSRFLPDNDGGRINTVIGRYIEPSLGYKDHSAPVRRSLDDIQADGGPREQTLSLPLVTDVQQVDRVIEIQRLMARLERRASIVLPPKFAGLEEGDWIAWQSKRRHNGATVRYQVQAYRQPETWRMYLTLREIASSVFGVPDPVEDTTTPPPPPQVIDALQLPGVEAEAITLPGSTSALPAIRFRWTAPVDAAVLAIRAEVRRVGETDAAPTRIDDVAKGQANVTNGVGPDQALECRLVPIGDPSRPVLASNWITVSTSTIVAGDLSPESPVVKRITAMQDAIDLASEGIGSIDTAIASLNATIYTAGTGLKARSDAMFADINTASTGLKAQTASLLASLNTPTTGVLARLTATEGQVATNNTAAVNRLNALEATVNTAGTGLTARLATAESAIVTNRDAAAQRLSALEATVDGAGTGLSAKVSGLQSAVSDLVSGKADATDLVNLTARVFGAESVNIAQDQRLTTVEVDVAGKASAVRVAALETSIDTPSTGLKARLAVQEAATSDLVANKADATRVAALEATVNTAGTGLSARVAGLQSAVSNLAQGKADAVDLVNLTARVFDAEGVNTAQNNRLNTVEVDIAGKASATRVEALEAAVNTPGTGLAARITTAEQAIATEATARAEAVSQLLARQNINRNLLPGGSGERGVVGWDAPAGLTVVDSPANGGSVFYKNYTGAGDVDHNLISPKVAIGEATHVTLSFKGGSQGFSGGVRLGYIGFYNDAGGYVGESATRPLTGGEVTAAKPSGATKAAFVARVSGTASSSYAEVFFRQIKIEPGQVATIYSNDALDQYLSSSVGELRQATIDLAAGKADATRVTSLEASVNTPGTGISARLTNVESVAASADGRAKAIKGIVTEVNGYIAGYSSSNDGTTAAFEILADVFAIRSPGGGERTEYRNGRWYIYSPAETTRTVYGKAFGGSQKITWWTGPDSVAEGAETKGNAYVYISQNSVGGARFGGSDVLGPGGTLTATASTGFIGGARNGAGYVNTSNQVTVTVSGGTSAATIRWTRISGDSRIQMNNATAFTTGAYATIGAGEVISAYFMGAITKGGQSAVVYVQVDLSDNGT